MSSKADFFRKLKTVVNTLQNEIEFQAFSEWNFKCTKQNIKKQETEIPQNQISYFNYAAILWELNHPSDLDIHFPGSKRLITKNTITDYYIMNDNFKFLYTMKDIDVESYFEYLEGKNKKKEKEFRNDILPLFLSSLAVNYFHNSFYKVMHPYFSSLQNSPLSFDQSANLSKDLLISLQENLYYCPTYILRLLTEEDELLNKFNLTPQEIVKTYILRVLISCPFLYAIDSVLENPEEFFKEFMQNFSNDLAENFIIILKDNNNDIFKLIPSEDDLSIFEVSTRFDDNFQNLYKKLLKISPKLPNELPKYLNSKNYSYNDIVEALVVNPGPNYFRRFKIFEKMKELELEMSLNTAELNKRYENCLEYMCNTHDSEAIAKLAQKNIHLSHIRRFINKFISIYRELCFFYIYQKDIKPETPDEYIKNPQKFYNFIKNSEKSLSNKKDGRNSENFKEIVAPENIYKSVIKNIKFDIFANLRRETLTFDRSLDAILQSYQYHQFENSPLQDLLSQYKDSFIELSNKFMSAFCNSTNPFVKTKEISQAYLEIVEKIKFKIGVDVEKFEEEDKNNFIFSLFCLMKPNKIMSVNVFLTEFVFDTNCVGFFKNSEFQFDYEDILTTQNILKTFINFTSKLNVFYDLDIPCPNFKYQSALLTRTCHYYASLVVNFDDNELEKLAVISDPDFASGDKNYDEVHQAFGTKSRIDFFKKLKPSDEINLNLFDSENAFYIFKVTFDENKKAEPLPTVKSELIKLISPKKKTSTK